MTFEVCRREASAPRLHAELRILLWCNHRKLLVRRRVDCSVHTLSPDSWGWAPRGAPDAVNFLSNPSDIEWLAPNRPGLHDSRRRPNSHASISDVHSQPNSVIHSRIHLVELIGGIHHRHVPYRFSELGNRTVAAFTTLVTLLRCLTVFADSVLVDEGCRPLNQPSNDRMVWLELPSKPLLQGALEGPDHALDFIDRLLNHSIGLAFLRRAILDNSGGVSASLDGVLEGFASRLSIGLEHDLAVAHSGNVLEHCLPQVLTVLLIHRTLALDNMRERHPGRVVSEHEQRTGFVLLTLAHKAKISRHNRNIPIIVVLLLPTMLVVHGSRHNTMSAPRHHRQVCQLVLFTLNPGRSHWLR